MEACTLITSGDLGTSGVGGSGQWARAQSQGRRKAAPECSGEKLRVGEGSCRKVEINVDFCLRKQDYERGCKGTVRGTFRCGGNPAAPAPQPFSRGGERSPRPGPRPSRPSGAARWIVGWGLRLPRGGLQRCLPGLSPAERGRQGEGRQSARNRRSESSGRGAAAAPLQAGNVGEAVAAAAEVALRTRGKLLADRTPGRDVKEPPLSLLLPKRSWA